MKRRRGWAPWRLQCIWLKRQEEEGEALCITVEPAGASASDPMVTDDYRGATEPAAASNVLASMFPTLQPDGADITPDRVRVKSWRRQSYRFGNRATENGVEGRWRERWLLSSLTLGELAVKEERLMVGEAVFVPDQ